MREENQRLGVYFGVYLCLSMPGELDESWEGSLPRSVGFEMTLQVGSTTKKNEVYLQELPQQCEIVPELNLYMSGSEMNIKMIFQKMIKYDVSS